MKQLSAVWRSFWPTYQIAPQLPGNFWFIALISPAAKSICFLWKTNERFVLVYHFMWLYYAARNPPKRCIHDSKHWHSRNLFNMICLLWWQLEISCLTSPSLELNSRSEAWLLVTQDPHICFILQWKSIYTIGWSAIKTFNMFTLKVHMRRTLKGFFFLFFQTAEVVFRPNYCGLRGFVGPRGNRLYLWRLSLTQHLLLKLEAQGEFNRTNAAMAVKHEKPRSPLLWISTTCWFPVWTSLSGPPVFVAWITSDTAPWQQ